MNTDHIGQNCVAGCPVSFSHMIIWYRFFVYYVRVYWYLTCYHSHWLCTLIVSVTRTMFKTVERTPRKLSILGMNNLEKNDRNLTFCDTFYYSKFILVIHQVTFFPNCGVGFVSFRVNILLFCLIFSLFERKKIVQNFYLGNKWIFRRTQKL